MAEPQSSKSHEDKNEPIRKPIEKKSFKARMMVARCYLGLEKITGVMETKNETKRRFLFDDYALRRGGLGRDLFMAEEPPMEDMNDIVDMDDDRIAQYVSQELVGGVVNSNYFKGFIYTLIAINSVVIALQTDEGMSVRYHYMFSIFDQVVKATFVCEVLLKWFYGFWVFWKSGWNILDFFIIASFLLGERLSSSRILRILRVMRIFRNLRSVDTLAGLSLVVQTILRSLPDMANILLLLLIVLLVFGVSGVTLFGTVVPDWFGDLPKAMFSLFICVTQEGWVDIYNAFKVQGGWIHCTGMLYFFCSIMVEGFVFANLVVAVVVTNLELEMISIRQEQTHANPITDGSANVDHEEISSVIDHKEFDKDGRYMRQNPLQYADLSEMSVEQFTNYNLLLVAFEENLTEYKNIGVDLDEIDTMIAALAVADEVEEETPSSQSLTDQLSGFKELKGGDVLSKLIRLNESHLVDSRHQQSMEHVIRSFGVEDKNFRRRSSIQRK